MIFIPLIIILSVVLVTASLLVIDLKTKELASQNLHTLEQQRSTFEISLNYELLKTKSAAEDFAAAIKDRSPENALPAFKSSLAADFLLYNDIRENTCFSSDKTDVSAFQNEIHTLLTKKNSFSGPETISFNAGRANGGAQQNPVFVFSAPVYSDGETIGFLGNIIYAENIFDKFMPNDSERKNSFVLCNKDGKILASTNDLAGLNFSVNSLLSGCINTNKHFLFKKWPLN
ncbi:MAG: cache domain-containing protein, partial [Spirochaetaceae bacterium]|nr:cache domain-containing protein [Spirochaetaceae bacterium]